MATNKYENTTHKRLCLQKVIKDLWKIVFWPCLFGSYRTRTLDMHLSLFCKLVRSQKVGSCKVYQTNQTIRAITRFELDCPVNWCRGTYIHSYIWIIPEFNQSCEGQSLLKWFLPCKSQHYLILSRFFYLLEVNQFALR